MPQMKFTDGEIKKLATPMATTWYSDPSVKGLRLCVTKTGVKTWYVTKWDKAEQKTRNFTIGPWATNGTNTAWAKEQVGRKVLDVIEGKQQTREERKVELAGIPTLRMAFDRTLERRLKRPVNQGGPISDLTAKGYRQMFAKYLLTWADSFVTEIDVAIINRSLDDLNLAKPFTAHKVSTVLSMTYKTAMRWINAPLVVPGIADGEKSQMGNRKESIDKDGNVKLDVTVPWADRWKEIEAVENEYRRLLWMVRWHTGQREETLRDLTWDDIDLTEGTMTCRGMKKVKASRLIAMSDVTKGLFLRLHEIKRGKFVFFSAKAATGRMDRLDRLSKTAPGDLRHLWNEATTEVAEREIVFRWLSGQRLTVGETQMLGHYSTVPVERQRRAANQISAVIQKRLEVTPSNVVEIRRASV